MIGYHASRGNPKKTFGASKRPSTSASAGVRSATRRRGHTTHAATMGVLRHPAPRDRELGKAEGGDWQRPTTRQQTRENGH